MTVQRAPSRGSVRGLRSWRLAKVFDGDQVSLDFNNPEYRSRLVATELRALNPGMDSKIGWFEDVKP